jgi:glycosyltransferase involved in cell wall biosynthesis
MRIGLICNEFPPNPTGGIGTFTVELVRGLVESGHRLHVIGVYNGLQADTVEANSPGLTVHRLAGGSGRSSGYLIRLRLFRLIRKLVAAGEINIIEVPDFEGWCAGWARLAVPVVVRLHGSATYFAREMHGSIPAATELIERLAIRRADRVLSVSRYTADRTAEIFDLTLSATVIYNSVLLPNAARVKTDYASGDLVAYSGTLTQKKGVFDLARAWPLVKMRRPNARLIMIGKDAGYQSRPSADAIRERAGCHADSITFVGHRPKPEMESLLIGADVAVYPSHSEAFALAPMESMALAIPTIYTTRSSGAELIRDGIDGLLCDPDNIEVLADQIVHLLESEPARRRFGEAGRRRIREAFPYEAALQNNISFYEQCTQPAAENGAAS